MKSGKVNMKDSLVVSYKIKHISYHKEHCAPCYLPEWVKNLCPNKDSHMDFYSSFIDKHQNLNTTKISFNKLTYK